VLHGAFLLLMLLLPLCLFAAGCARNDNKPAQLYDPGKEAEQKKEADQAQAAYRKKMHDEHMPGY
jgi:hypothetical protein